MKMNIALLFTFAVASANALNVKLECERDIKALQRRIDAISTDKKIKSPKKDIEALQRRIDAISTPEYRAKNEHEVYMDVLYDQIEKSNCPDPYFFSLSSECRRTRFLLSELSDARKKHRDLVDAACSTEAYNKWYNKPLH